MLTLPAPGISPELQRLLEYVGQLPEYDPAHLDDAADVIDFEMSDADLARICQQPVGRPVLSRRPPLGYSCELRKSLWNELTDLALADDGDGWLTDLLAPGYCAAVLARYARQTRKIQQLDRRAELHGRLQQEGDDGFPEMV